MRCRTCGQRILRDLAICPHCGHQPLFFHTRWSFTLVSILLGLGLGFSLVPFAPGPPATALPSAQTTTPLPQPSRRPTFTPTPTATPRPTATPTETPTPQPTVTATPTSATIVSNTPTTIPTLTATPRPTVAPPRLINPKDQAEFGGEDTLLFLEWEGVLQEGQQFAVTVRYIGKGNDTKTVGSWLRETRWRMPIPVYRDISLTLRALKWDVTVIDSNGDPLSAPSESRIFIWVP